MFSVRPIPLHRGFRRPALRVRPLAHALLAAGLLFTALSGAGLRMARAAENADDEFAAPASWNIPTAATVRPEVIRWLDARKVEPALRERVLKELWPAPAAPAKTDAKQPVAPKQSAATDPPSTEMLERLVKTFAAVDGPSKELFEFCSHPLPTPATKLPAAAWLADAKTPPLVRNNMRLWYGRWLAQQNLYDESLDRLQGLQAANVVDPATLLFYQAADCDWLTLKEPGVQAVGKLLEQKNHIPQRYAQLGERMQSELHEMKDDTLPMIDRHMRDNARLLDQAHAGKHVQGVEKGIINSLDKLIKQAEDEEAAAMAAAMMGPGSKQSRSPAPDSAPLKGGGPGQVAPRDTGHLSGWGQLDDKEREEAMQTIGQEFPSHFRDVIQQYFKRMAGDESGDDAEARQP